MTITTKKIGAAQFKEQCLSLLDNIGTEGLIMTKHGKPVAKLVPIEADSSSLIGLSSDTWSISAIVLWELCKLAELGRVDIDVDDADVVRALHRIHTWTLTLETSRQSCRLDFGGDTADHIVAATSFIHNVPLVTGDKTIRKSKMTPLA